MNPTTFDVTRSSSLVSAALTPSKQCIRSRPDQNEIESSVLIEFQPQKNLASTTLFLTYLVELALVWFHSHLEPSPMADKSQEQLELKWKPAVQQILLFLLEELYWAVQLFQGLSRFRQELVISWKSSPSASHENRGSQLLWLAHNSRPS